MSNEMEKHLPSPEFRASLEENVARALRYESRRAVDRRAIWGRRLRLTALLAATLISGVAIGAQPAQIIDTMRREAAVQLQRQTVAMLEARVQQASEAAARVRLRQAVAGSTVAELTEAEAVLKQLEHQLEKARLDLAAAQITAATAPNSLSAPMYGDRDFVKEGLQLDLGYAEQSLRLLEEQTRIARQRANIAAITKVELAQQEMKLDDARDQVDLLVAKIALRDRFHREKTPVTTIETLSKVEELRVELRSAERKQVAAAERVKRARELFAVAAITQIELFRAEIEAHETTELVAALQKTIQTLARFGGGG